MQRHNVHATHRRPKQCPCCALSSTSPVPVQLDPFPRALEARFCQRWKHAQSQQHEAYPQDQHPPKGRGECDIIHPHPLIVNFACHSADDVRRIVRAAVHLDAIEGLDQVRSRGPRHANSAGVVQQLKLGAGGDGHILFGLHIVSEDAPRPCPIPAPLRSPRGSGCCP